MTATRAPSPARRAPSPGPAAPAPRRAPLRVVDPAARSPRSRRRRARLLWLGTAALVCAGLFALAAMHVVLTEGQLELDRLAQQAGEQRARYDRLRLRVAELEAPDRIAAVAQQRLGMVPPPDVTYLSPSGAKSDAPAAETSEDGAPRDDAPDADGSGSGWASVKAQLTGRP